MHQCEMCGNWVDDRFDLCARCEYIEKTRAEARKQREDQP